MTPWTVTRQASLSMQILQARILECVAMPSSRGSSQHRDWTRISQISGRSFTIWATREALLSLDNWHLVFVCSSAVAAFQRPCLGAKLILTLRKRQKEALGGRTHREQPCWQKEIERGQRARACKLQHTSFKILILNFMAAVTIFSDFGAPQNKICHCFQFFPIYLPWIDGAGCHDLHFMNVEF